MREGAFAPTLPSLRGPAFAPVSFLNKSSERRPRAVACLAASLLAAARGRLSCEVCRLSDAAYVRIVAPRVALFFFCARFFVFHVKHSAKKRPKTANVSRETLKIYVKILKFVLRFARICGIMSLKSIKHGENMAKIISFANQKGGVGKTTSAVNVAASLGIIGFRTLIVDLDPQGNTTSGVGISKKALKMTTKEALLGQAKPDEVIIKTNFENLSVIPCNVSLAGAEFDLFDYDSAEYRLKNFLSEVKDDFDYIIIDCPPSLGMLTVNAMSASDGVVVPMQCEFYALEGLSQLIMTIKRINKLYNPELSVCGILVTMYNRRLLLSAQVISELEKHYGDRLFDTKISRNVKLSEAPSFGKPVYYHDKRGKSTLEYIEVAKELSKRI